MHRTLASRLTQLEIHVLHHLDVLVRIAVLFACVLKPLSAAQHWISVSTPHFSMYTTNSEKQAVRSLQVFEQVRYFFLQRNKSKQGPEEQVRIIAFSSEREFKPYRPNDGTFAYYQQSRERDYIVMQDIEPEHQQAALHEYTHLIVQHAKLDLPAWLNEGMADLYSSLEPHGQQAMVGRTIPGRIYTLTQQPWMDWNVLLSVDHRSPFYNEKEKMSIFYAQSFALTHMLMLSSSYMQNFSPLMELLSNGTPAPEAFKKTYGKTIAEVGDDVKAYVQQSYLKAAIYNISLSKLSLDPQVETLTDFQASLALAELLASQSERAVEAKNRLLALKAQEPGNPEVDESLGYLAWQTRNTEDARAHFASAVHNNSKNVSMLLDYARLADGADSSSQVPVDLTKSAITLAPDNTPAKILLTRLEAERHHYGLALSTIAAVKKVEPDQAFDLFSVTAFCHANLRDFTGATEAAQRAVTYAKTAAQRAEIDHLTDYINEQSKSAMNRQNAPPESKVPAPALLNDSDGSTSAPIQHVNRPHVVGLTKAFECGDGTFQLRVQVGEKEMEFRMNNLKDVIVRGVADLEWSCGPLKPQSVTVFYKTSDSPKVAGTITELVF